MRLKGLSEGLLHHQMMCNSRAVIYVAYKFKGKGGQSTVKGWESGQGYGYCGKLPSYRPSPLEFTRREYGYTVAAVKATLEYLMPPMERSTLPRRIPCSNKETVTI